MLLCAWSANFSSPAHGQERVIPEARIESVRSLGLGTGARASAVSTQAQAENPANLSAGGLYHVEAFMGYQPQMKRIGAGAAVVDSMTSRLAAGLSARGLFGDNDSGENAGWEGRLGLGFPFGDVLSIGIAGRYSNYTVSDPKAIPETPRLAGSTTPIDQTFRLKAFTLDAALTLRPIEGFSISALGYNLIDTESPLAPLMVGGSAALTLDAALTLGGDVLVDLNTHESFDDVKLIAGGGIEYLASGVIPLRVGYQYDQGRKQNSITGGIGFVDGAFGAQMGLRQSISGYKESTIMGVLQYFVQ
jgi:opacity protein-like surface antigen